MFCVFFYLVFHKYLFNDLFSSDPHIWLWVFEQVHEMFHMLMPQTIFVSGKDFEGPHWVELLEGTLNLANFLM